MRTARSLAATVAVCVGGFLLFAVPASALEGAVDRSFGTDGFVTTGFSGEYSGASSLAIDSHGRLIAAGTANHEFFSNLALARYTPSGSLDTSFGAGGQVDTSFRPGAYDSADSVAIDSLGRIVVAGSSSRPPRSDFAVARYEPDGSLDSAFGNGGKVITDFGGDFDAASSVAIDAQDRVVAGGFSANGPDSAFALARYNPDGSLDHSFGSGGEVRTQIAGGASADSIAIDSRGRIVAAGSRANGPKAEFALARYKRNGNLDDSFGTDGVTSTDFGGSGSDFAQSVVIDPHGRPIAAGIFNSRGPPSKSDFALARYEHDGSLDDSFGTGGMVTTAFGTLAVGRAVAIDAFGRPVVAGFAYNGQNYDAALARYKRDGRLDPSFGTDGRVTTDFPLHEDDSAESVAIDPRERIVTAGGAYQFELARYIGEAPPRVTLTGPRKVKTRQRKARARFSFDANEPVKFKCKLVSRKARHCYSHFRTPRLVVGKHRFKVRATDRAGNTTTETQRFRIVRKR